MSFGPEDLSTLPRRCIPTNSLKHGAASITGCKNAVMPGQDSVTINQTMNACGDPLYSDIFRDFDVFRDLT